MWVTKQLMVPIDFYEKKCTKEVNGGPETACFFKIMYLLLFLTEERNSLADLFFNT